MQEKLSRYLVHRKLLTPKDTKIGSVAMSSRQTFLSSALSKGYPSPLPQARESPTKTTLFGILTSEKYLKRE
jgi:hypothetical protein